ncbi:unnamed protein product, partial [Rotaria sp. Silwood2]
QKLKSGNVPNGNVSFYQ